MVDNVHWLPETYGPELVKYYERLLNEPLPQRLKDLLTMLEEAARVEAAAPPETNIGHQAQLEPQAREPEPAK